MRIVNNNIEILRGETATYDVNVIDDQTGYPFTVDGITNPYIEFTVKKSVYDKDPIYRNYIDMSSVAGIGPYTTDHTEDVLEDADATTADQNVLYYMKDTKKYYYSDGTNWHEYVFNIRFTFPYEKVSKFEVKTYKYQINVLGGTLKTSYESDECPINVSYSNPILKPHDFVVGGSLSE